MGRKLSPSLDAELGEIVLLAIILSLAVQAQAAPPQTPAPTPDGVTEVAPATVVAPKAPPEKVICRTETPTGSTIPKRVCRTETQISARNQRSKEDVQKLLDLRNIRPPPGEGG
jgi:hypothetical protein